MITRKTRQVVESRKCYDCNAFMEGRQQNYAYTESGLKSVTLKNILVFNCANCGAIVPEIPNTMALHHAIATNILRKKHLLSGDEIRFLRKVAGLSATELATIMGTAKSTVSRWETGAKNIGKESDRQLRLLCFTQMVSLIFPEHGRGLGDNPVKQVLEASRMFRSFNIHGIFREIDKHSAASEPLRIDPNDLAQFGVNDPCMMEVAESVQ